MMIRMLDRRQPSRAIRDARQVAAALSVSLQRFAGPGVGLAVAGLLCLLEGVVRPYGPDLSAQIARADASARGVTIWWAGWYGGTNVVGYSWLSGPVMQHVGVIAVAILACLAIAVLAGDLLRGCRRPVAGSAASALAAGADMFSGRVTFAVGMVAALAALALLRRGRLVPAAAAAAVSGPASPLAALFVVVAVAALAVTDRRAWLRALLVGAAAALPVAGSALVFGQPSVMPFGAVVLIPTLLTCALLAAAPAPPAVRAAAAISAAIALIAFLVPSEVGSTAGRVPMLAAGPVLLATVRWPTRQVIAAVVGLAVWPAVNLATDLRPSSDPSVSAGYYQPLLGHLPATGRATRRLEVVDPSSHGADAYLPARIPLARGWLRADDFAANRLFYEPALSATDYRSWLSQHAVGWVALPDVSLDYGARTEGRLVAAGVPFLRQVWHGEHWRLFEVAAPAPMADGVAAVTAMSDTAIELHARSAGLSTVRLPYNRLLSLRGLGGQDVGCVAASADGTGTVLSIPAAGSYLLRGDLDALASTASAC